MQVSQRPAAIGRLRSARIRCSLPRILRQWEAVPSVASTTDLATSADRRERKRRGGGLAPAALISTATDSHSVTPSRARPRQVPRQVDDILKKTEAREKKQNENTKLTTLAR
jgi:hypothetical protein